MAGARKGSEGGKLGALGARERGSACSQCIVSRAHNFPLPLPLLAPAKQAKCKIIISSFLIGSLDL